MKTGTSWRARTPLRTARPDHGLGRPPFERGLHELVGEEGGGVDKLLAPGRGLGRELLRDVLDPDRLALGAVEVEGLHGDQVDEASEGPFEADGDLHQHGPVAELLGDLVADLERVGPDPVGLVDESDEGDVVAAQLPVDGDRLGLDAADRAENEDGRVEDPQGALDLDGEIDVTRRVDDIDGVVGPLDVGRGRGDGDAALPLEVHGVHGRADAVLALDLVDLVDLLAIEEDPLRQRRLARVDVGADADVAHAGDVGRHGQLTLFLNKDSRLSGCSGCCR